MSDDPRFQELFDKALAEMLERGQLPSTADLMMLREAVASTLMSMEPEGEKP